MTGYVAAAGDTRAAGPAPYAEARKIAATEPERKTKNPAPQIVAEGRPAGTSPFRTRTAPTAATPRYPDARYRYRSPWPSASTLPLTRNPQRPHTTKLPRLKATAVRRSMERRPGSNVRRRTHPIVSAMPSTWRASSVSRRNARLNRTINRGVVAVSVPTRPTVPRRIPAKKNT